MKEMPTPAVQNQTHVMMLPAERTLIVLTVHAIVTMVMKVTPIPAVQRFAYQAVAHLVLVKQVLVVALKFKRPLVKTVRVLCTILAEQRAAQNKARKIVTAHVLKKQHVAEAVRVARNAKMEPVLMNVFH